MLGKSVVKESRKKCWRRLLVLVLSVLLLLLLLLLLFLVAVMVYWWPGGVSRCFVGCIYKVVDKGKFWLLLRFDNEYMLMLNKALPSMPHRTENRSLIAFRGDCYCRCDWCSKWHCRYLYTYLCNGNSINLCRHASHCFTILTICFQWSTSYRIHISILEIYLIRVCGLDLTVCGGRTFSQNPEIMNS